MTVAPHMLVTKELSAEVEQLSHDIIGAAMEVHTHLGPGLLESLYEEALAHELKLRGMSVKCQAEIAVPYKDIVLHGQRLDLIVNATIIVELKATSKLHEVHGAQLLSHLRAVGLPLGLLMNFNEVRLTNGLRRVFNDRATQYFRNPNSSSRPSRPSR